MSEVSPFENSGRHRMLPSSTDAERAMLASYLRAPAEVGALCCERRLGHEDFTVPGLAIVYRALTEMWEQSKPIDLVTVACWLGDRGMFEQIGGMGLLLELDSYLGTAANAGYYLDILQEKSTLREIIRVCTTAVGRGYDEQDNVGGVLDDTERQIFEIVSRRHGRHSKRKKTRELVTNALRAIQSVYERHGEIGGLSTGVSLLDEATDGLHPQELIVLASRPSHGKTAMAMQMAEHLAVDQGVPVGIFSLEMSGEQLMQRQLCSRARVSMCRVRSGDIDVRDLPALTAACTKLAEAKIYIEEGSDMTIQVLRARSRALHAQYGIRALFVDSLSVLRADGYKPSERWREVGAVVNGLKECAKELGIPIVVIAHLGRAADREPRPSMAHLRESGNVEQDADSVWFLVREELFAKSDEDAEELAGQATLRIGKSRTGEMNLPVPLTYLKEYAKFENRAEDPRKPVLKNPRQGRRGYN